MGREHILDLAAPSEGFRRVVRGIDRDRRGVVKHGLAISLDGGAGHGGPLIAACFDVEGAVIEIVEA